MARVVRAVPFLLGFILLSCGGGPVRSTTDPEADGERRSEAPRPVLEPAPSKAAPAPGELSHRPAAPGPDQRPEPPPLDWQWQAGDGPIVEVVRGQVRLGELHFDIGKPTLKSSSVPLIERLHAFLQAHPRITRLRIESHSDDRGSRQYNRELTRRRAHAVARALVRLGVACARLETYGFGVMRPILSEGSNRGRNLSRRVELHIAAYDGVDLAPHSVADYGVTGSADACQPLPPWP
jgi:outer membrane protein OmpA-like peptidoglycan-associated protein